MTRVVGAVLCGGASSRMGRDKALVRVHGVPMAVHVATALLGGGCGEVFAVGGDAESLAGLGMALVHDLFPGEGPLGGIVTALRAAGDADLVVVASCDIALLDAPTVSALVATLAGQVGADVAVAVTPRIQPLCAAWRPRVVDQLEGEFAAGERSPRAALTALSVVEVAVAAEVLVNFNTVSDLPD